MRTQTFSGTQAAEIVGITYRRLDYWARTDLVRPSATDATGSGSRRSYTYRDLLELKAELVAKGDVKSMREATALAKEIERREKPEIDKLQADIKLLHDTLKKCAADWAKAGSTQSVEKLTAAILALSK